MICKALCAKVTAVLVVIGLLWAGAAAFQATSQAGSARMLASILGSAVPESYPADPNTDISWSAGLSGVADVQAAFNAARTTENNQLGKSIPMMTLPSQAQWNIMTNGQKGLWLINRERIDRGVKPLHGLEVNIESVAQTYAQYLFDHDEFSHTADGRNPFQRVAANPTIGACYDFLNVVENLYAQMTTGNSIPLPVEQAVYGWMYEDKDCCNWGHRHAILWYPYNDNSGPPGVEGFLGIGRANGNGYMGPYFGEVIVMNVFDPCSSWDYNPVFFPFVTK